MPRIALGICSTMSRPWITSATRSLRTPTHDRCFRHRALLYLSLIYCTELLPRIFEKVLIPQAVADELSDPSAPAQAAALIEHRPLWLHVCDVPATDPFLHHLGRG